MARFGSDNQPVVRKPRGKGRKTLWIEGLLANGYEDEQSFFNELIGQCKSDPALTKFLVDRFYPFNKTVYPEYKIKFPKDATPYQRSEIIIKAMANGSLPADIASEMIKSIRESMKIKDIDELQDLVKELQENLNKAMQKIEDINMSNGYLPYFLDLSWLASDKLIQQKLDQGEITQQLVDDIKNNGIATTIENIQTQFPCSRFNGCEFFCYKTNRFLSPDECVKCRNKK